MLLIILMVAVIYALPNLFPEDPSIQISHDSGELPAGLQAQIESVLSAKGLENKSIEIDDSGQMLVRFADTDTQLIAVDEFKGALDSQHIVALNLAPAVPSWLKALNASPMSLGLDLRGGVHFLLQVDMNAAVQKSLDRYEGEFRTLLRDKKIRYLSVDNNGEIITVKFRDQENYQKGLDELKNEFRTDLDFAEASIAKGFALNVSFKDAAKQELQTFAVQQNTTTLRKRVNELGVAEPVIQRQGLDRIVVQLPGVQDTTQAKNILGATATLEFRIVDEQADAYSAQQTGQVPVGDKLYFERNGTPRLLKRKPKLEGEYITDASSGIDQDSAGPAVFISLDGEGARKF